MAGLFTRIARYFIKRVIDDGILLDPNISREITKSVTTQVYNRLKRSMRIQQVCSNSVIIKANRNNVYTLFEGTKDGILYGTIDLSEMRPGDEIILLIYSVVLGKKLLVGEYHIENAQYSPAYVIPSLFITNGSTICMKFTRGNQIEIGYEFYLQS